MIDSHRVQVGNTNSRVAFILNQNGKPIVIGSNTVKVFGKKEDYTSWIAETTTGVTVEMTNTFTASGTTGLATHAGHIVKDGYRIRVSNSGGALPSGLAASTPYYAVNVTDSSFGLAATPGGVSVIAGAGTGTNSYWIDGLVKYDWQASDVASAGTFRLYFNVYSGSEYDTFPTISNGVHNPGFLVYVVDAS